MVLEIQWSSFQPTPFLLPQMKMPASSAGMMRIEDVCFRLHSHLFRLTFEIVVGIAAVDQAGHTLRREAFSVLQDLRVRSPAAAANRDGNARHRLGLAPGSTARTATAHRSLNGLITI